MLVIARKVGQTLLIGDDIEVTISAIRGDQVRLAINAPRSVSILRREVVEQVEEGNLAAIDAAAGVMDLVGAEKTGASHPTAPVVARTEPKERRAGAPDTRGPTPRGE